MKWPEGCIMSYTHILCPVLIKKLCDVCQVSARQVKWWSSMGEGKWDGLPRQQTLLKDQKWSCPAMLQSFLLKRGVTSAASVLALWNISFLLHTPVWLGEQKCLRHSAEMDISDHVICVVDTGAAGSDVHGSQRRVCIIAILIFHSLYDGCVQPSP